MFVLIPQGLYAFENQRTHPAITERAATESILDGYLKTQIGMNDGINTQLSYDFPSEIQARIDRAHWDSGRTQRPVLEWLRVGSAIEDTDEYPIHPIRPRHHFYDPNRNAGLNNKDDNPYWIGWPEVVMGLRGSSALIWAVNGTALQYPTTNNQSWQSSRTDFYNSLIESLKNDREKYLAMTFLDLGCVLHMVEDMGVPAHTRNDFLFAHYRSVYTRDYGNPLEMWAEGQVAAAGNNIPANWLTGWTPAPKVFDKVSDYFDTDTRNAGSYLGDGISPPVTWGLAEATNYQFFSWSTISPLTSSLYYFPHPDIDRCNVREESGRTYLYGYAVDHLAKFTMSEDFLSHGHLEQAWCTMGETIYNDYVRITIPRTIDYATGLANYFFRGRLSAEANCIDCNTFELTITNESINSGVQQTLKGGIFELYWDDASGNRTQVGDFMVDGWGSSSTLAYGAHTTGTFTKPEGEVEKYILIYKGNICANPADSDPDDSEAITVCKFQVEIPDNCCGYSCECCGDNPTPYQLKVTFSGVTLCEDCAVWGGYSRRYYNISFDINREEGWILTKQGPDYPCCYLSGNIGSVSYREYASPPCNGYYTNYTCSQIQIILTSECPYLTHNKRNIYVGTYPYHCGQGQTYGNYNCNEWPSRSPCQVFCADQYEPDSGCFNKSSISNILLCPNRSNATEGGTVTIEEIWE
jgi:hypothetical protein